MAERADFLVEIGTEEMPPRPIPLLSQTFAQALGDQLQAAGVEHGDVRVYATPRRLAVLIESLAAKQPDQREERRGPPVRVAYDDEGKPTRAALAFAESCGISADELETVETDKGSWLVYRADVKGRQVGALLPEMVNQALAKLPVPKPMRWGEKEVEFVRPVHWVVMLHGSEVVEGEVLGLRAGRVTRGHRFMTTASIALASASEYADRLAREGKVIADFAERRDRVRELAEAAAREVGGAAVIQPDVLDEVTALVEWPVPVAGHFDESFLELPPEVLVATLQGHQRYFPVTDAGGTLLPGFVSISNIESARPEVVRAGNERVVRPRLADAAFFYDTDRKEPLAARREALKTVVFQRNLGTLYDKSQRVSNISQQLAEVTGASIEMASRAAELAKCDLLTDMVGEFPELQGVMGRYYARHDGEPEEVAQAIAEQYLPRFAGDRLPVTASGRGLAVADKLDTLVSIFATGERPTGRKDPFGLRRAALGVLRIAIEGELELDLEALIPHAAGLVSLEIDLINLSVEVYDYIMERLRSYYLEGHEGITTEMFDAVLSRRPARPLDFHQRIVALREFMALEAAASLTAANKRIANILKQAKEKVPDQVDEASLEEAAEWALFRQLSLAQEQIEPAISQRDYTSALGRLAELRHSVDEFFDTVMVMAEDSKLRSNRLALLGQLRRLFLYTADLSRLPSP